MSSSAHAAASWPPPSRRCSAARRETVGDTSRYAENNGVPAKRKDVIVYGLPGYRGARDCIEGSLRQGDKGQLPRKWWNNIESFRWVTRTECAKAGIIQLPFG